MMERGLDNYGTFYLHGGTIPAYEVESVNKQKIVDIQDTYFKGFAKREITRRSNGSYRWRAYGTPVIKAIINELPNSPWRYAKMQEILFRAFIART